jgi:hypothetical protein
LGGQRRLRGLDDTLCKCVPVLRVHRCKTPVLKLTVHARCALNVSAIIHRVASDFQGLVDVVSSTDHRWLGSWCGRWRNAGSCHRARIRATCWLLLLRQSSLVVRRRAAGKFTQPA